MHLIVTTLRGADIKVEVANFCAAMDTLIDQDRGISELLPALKRAALLKQMNNVAFLFHIFYSRTTLTGRDRPFSQLALFTIYRFVHKQCGALCM